MAIDKTNSKATSSMKPTENSCSPPTRMGHLLARKQRIERWAYQTRSSSISGQESNTFTVQTSSTQKRSESLYSQTGRKLNIHLLQLSEQRQRVIEQHNFGQKLFANKQAIKYKDNSSIVSTLSYVRKCCKYVDELETKENAIDPTIFLEENQNRRRSRSRSPSTASPTPINKRNLLTNSQTQTSASLAETFLRHNRKHLESHRSTPTNRKANESRASTITPSVDDPNRTPTVDDETQKRHVQFRIQSDENQLDGSNEPIINKAMPRTTISAFAVRCNTAKDQQRSSNSAPLIRTASSATHRKENAVELEQKRRLICRIRSPKDLLQDFRRHPERYLSASNRYLPLLKRQALEAEHKASYVKEEREKSESLKRRMVSTISPSRLSDGSDMTYDDVKSFLSEETDFGKTTPSLYLEQETKSTRRNRPSSKIDMMDVADEESSERRMALMRCRDREYAHLSDLIQSKMIEDILQPLSPMKTIEDQPNENEADKRKTYSETHTSSSDKKIIVTEAKTRPLAEILNSIDSLQSADINDQRAQRKVDMEKNRAKLGILIF